MTNEEMIVRVEERHRSQPGYNFDPAVVDAIIRAGTIPEGYIVYRSGDNTVKIEQGEARTYKAGKLIQVVPLTGTALEAALMQYAYKASTLSTCMGRI